MDAVLSQLDTFLSRLELDEDTKEHFSIVHKECRDSLEHLENELMKNKSLGTSKKRLRDKLRWGMEDVSSL